MQPPAYIIALTAILTLTNTEYVPPGPAYPCPKETAKLLLYPCVCVNGTDAGLFVRCENSGLAAISLGIGNIAGLGLPIEELVLKDLKVVNLFGPLFHRSSIRILRIEGAPIVSIDKYAFAGVNRTLQHLYIEDSAIEEFPKDALKILGNLTSLHIKGHRISKLGKDIFAGSEAAGRLERLHIINGLISDVAPEAFQNLKKLKTLDLHGNELVNLKRNQFKGLRDTEVLDLSYNKITKLDGSHIGDLTKLGWCNVSHNDISEMPRGMFARNTVLKVLHLDNNKLKKLDTNSFRGMRFLRRLYLQDNKISDIGRGTFSAVTRIGTVDLARNMIDKVDYQMFQSVKYAEIINLAENNITLIENQAFSDLYLATVNISYNKLSKIEPNSFINCNNMTVLDLSHNNLTEIDIKAFDENTYAFELQVSYNFFTDLIQVPINNMTGIRILNASHNQIERIPKGSIPKLYELHTIDVSYNNLSDIHNGIFQNLFSLRYLDLSHNSLRQIKPATFGTIPTVLQLSLAHNQLSDISRGSLAKLASCRVLDVSYNMLDKVFQIPISLAELNIANNLLTEVKANTWPTMNALLRLNLSSNLLEELSSDTFASLLTLQILDLSNNGLSRPPWQALSSLTSLQYLFLQNNNITSLSKTAFGILPTMFELNLSHNGLSSIGEMSFGGLQQLLKLTLSHNELERIPNEAFKSLVALRHLDLSHNQLERIDNKTNGLLDDCLSLERVDLSYNKFSIITKKMFPYNQYIPYKLYEIDLSYNEIPILTHDLTIGTKKLKKLNVSHNIINEIRNNVLGNLTNLEVLDVSHNELKSLNSINSDSKLKLPETITYMDLSYNLLETLPIEQISNATKLNYLDVRNNSLTNFDLELVRRVKQGLNVYFEGNKLYCNCLVRPLKHYLNHQSHQSILTGGQYTNIMCDQPDGLMGENILTVDEERLICDGNIIPDTGNTDEIDSVIEKFNFVSEPDLAFRDVQTSQTSIYVHWFVLSTEDIADFHILIRDAKNNIYHTDDLPYNTRSTTIQIDDKFKDALKNKMTTFEVCLQSKDSTDSSRRWFFEQCQVLPSNFDSWPKKLTIDKRRLTKKKRVYGWFSNSVLGLVSDSILITLCIFLGVCFRRLADFE